MLKNGRPTRPISTRPIPKKRFGQHFLVHRAQIENILDLLQAEPKDSLLEIGPGPGTLTLPMDERGFSLTLVETDLSMIQHLQNQPFQKQHHLIHADFLELDLDSLITTPTKVVSNLPYNVSVPITAKLLRKMPLISRMVLMYQREVAVRIAAAPKSRDYGMISVLCQCFYDIEKGFDLSPGSFQPPPKVWSRVLVFKRRAEPSLALENLEQMESLLAVLFSHRRKMIAAILKKWVPGWTTGPALLESYLSCGFDPQWRPEVLAPDDYSRWLRAALSR